MVRVGSLVKLTCSFLPGNFPIDNGDVGIVVEVILPGGIICVQFFKGVKRYLLVAHVVEVKDISKT